MHGPQRNCKIARYIEKPWFALRERIGYLRAETSACLRHGQPPRWHGRFLYGKKTHFKTTEASKQQDEGDIIRQTTSGVALTIQTV